MVEADDLDGPDYRQHYPECARVTISMLGGDVFTGFLGAATGMPENPMSDDALSEKFRACTAFAGWPDDKAETVLVHLREIANAAAISAVVRGDA